MKHARRTSSQRRRAWIAFGSTALLAVAATAQVVGLDNTTYRDQLEACRGGSTYQQREDCVREVRAAQAARQQGQLRDGSDHTANALARCEVYREQEDVQACRARVMGQGDVSGSVAGGGLLRQYEYTVPAEPRAGAAPAESTMGAGTPLPPLSPPAPESRLNPQHPAARMAPAPQRVEPSSPASIPGPVFPMYQK